MSSIPSGAEAIAHQRELRAKAYRDRLETAVMQEHGPIVKIERISNEGLLGMLTEEAIARVQRGED